MSTTIIIPQSGRSHLTCHAVSQIRSHENSCWPVVVIDNGGDAASLRQLHQMRYEHVSIRQLSRPGLTRAWNVAARMATTRWLVFLNNDTETTGPWVESLIHPLREGRSPVAAVELRWEMALRVPIQVPSGWCFAIERTWLLEQGGFDESMHLYFSDTDIFLRARQARGPGAWTAVNGLPLRHFGHQTTCHLNNRRSQWYADYRRFLARWSSHEE